MQSLLSRETVPGSKGNDEYGFIHDVVNESIREIQEANHKLEEQKKTNKGIMVFGLQLKTGQDFLS